MNKKLIFPALLMGVGVFFLARSCSAHGNEWEVDEFQFSHYNLEFRHVNGKYLPSRSEKAKWQEAYENHMFHAKRTYEDAKEKCWYLPRVNDRDKARYCFTTAIATVGSTSPTGRLVAAVTTFLVQYGLDSMDEWDYIQEKLHWSEYHFDMCDHYQNLINNA